MSIAMEGLERGEPGRPWTVTVGPWRVTAFWMNWPEYDTSGYETGVTVKFIEAKLYLNGKDYDDPSQVRIFDDRETFLEFLRGLSTGVMPEPNRMLDSGAVSVRSDLLDELAMPAPDVLLFPREPTSTY